MVSSNNGNTSIAECLAQHKLVDRCLDGWIDLDFSTQLLVVELGKKEMTHTGLSSDVS